MKYRKVRNIQDELSVIGFGCWSVASYNWTHGDISEAERAIQTAIDHGINFFDVAPVYGYGESEQLLGEVLSRNGNRNKVFVATKCGLRWDEKDGPTRNDLSKSSVLHEIDLSLKRLKTDHVDLYQLHWPDHHTPLAETIETLTGLIKQGKIRYVGLSNYSLSDLKKANEYLPIASYQGLYNLFDRNSESYCGIPLEYRSEDEILPYCLEQGIAFIPYSPLNQGLLSGRYYKNRDKVLSPSDMRLTNPELVGERLDEKLEIMKAFQELSSQTPYTITELALGWLIANPAITTIIVGSRTPQYAIQNSAIGDIQLPKDTIDSINLIFS